jgi:surface polysaccharide O-acyltransferase-like enzyme
MLGYFVLNNEKLLKRLDKYRFLLLGAATLYSVITAFVLNWEFYEMASWLWILALLGIGNHYLNFNGKTTAYLSSSSFGIYIFHQSWIVIVTFFIFKVIDNPALQIPAIFITSVVLTYLTYEICRRFGLTRFMFGLKK